MPKVTIAVPHAVGKEQAVERVKGMMNQIKEKYKAQVSNLTDEWSGDTLNFGFTTYGFNIKGALAVEDSQVKLDGDLPFAAMMFKGRIEQEVRDQLNKLLA
jgi:putative polyhydroxyalkanoate system protein